MPPQVCRRHACMHGPLELMLFSAAFSCVGASDGDLLPAAASTNKIVPQKRRLRQDLGLGCWHQHVVCGLCQAHLYSAARLVLIDLSRSSTYMSPF